jgi:hypothetical protein
MMENGFLMSRRQHTFDVPCHFILTEHFSLDYGDMLSPAWAFGTSVRRDHCEFSQTFAFVSSTFAYGNRETGVEEG